jgi:V-type H+-transporting ATPase subunit d
MADLIKNSFIMKISNIAILLNPTDVRLQLSATDYGNFLQNEPSPISTSTISEKLTQRLVAEFDFLRTQAVQPLAKFLDYIT